MLSESFGHAVFKNSLRRVFHSGDYDLGLSSKYGFMNFILILLLSRIADYSFLGDSGWNFAAKLIYAYIHGADSLFSSRSFAVLILLNLELLEQISILMSLFGLQWYI